MSLNNNNKLSTHRRVQELSLLRIPPHRVRCQVPALMAVQQQPAAQRHGAAGSGVGVGVGAGGAWAGGGGQVLIKPACSGARQCQFMWAGGRDRGRRR